jgi:hypothetical protein
MKKPSPARKIGGSHRNPQLLRPGNKKYAARLAAMQASGKKPEPAEAKPLRAKQRKRRIIRRGPRKLTPSLIKRFVASIRETGGPIMFHCRALGVGESTYYEWRDEAKANAAPIYREFVEAVDKAQGERLKLLYLKAEHAKPHEILFRQFPELFPSEATRMHLSGVGDSPLFPTENQFNVVLELHRPEQPTEPEPAFRIVRPGGQGADLWQPPQPNGERPPHS